MYGLFLRIILQW